jgi:hypothetical protein
VFLEEFITHRFEAATQLIWINSIERSPEGCPVGDILWRGIVQGLPKRVIALDATFDGVE